MMRSLWCMHHHRRMWKRTSVAAMVTAATISAPFATAQAPLDTVGAIAAVQRLYRAFDTRDTAQIRVLASADARIIGPNASGELRAPLMQVAIRANAAPTEREVTQLRPFRLTVRADFAEVWLEYNVAVRGRSARCGIAVVDLQGKRDAWRAIALMNTQRVRSCPLPGLTEPSAPRGRAESVADAATIVDRARNAERVFFVQWRRAWLATEIARDSLLTRSQPRPIALTLPTRRVKAAHCHSPSDVLSSSELTTSAGFKLSACAIWYAGDGEPPHDERIARDTAIHPSLRGDIDTARGSVLSLLDSANAANPREFFAVSQLVRLFVDRGNAAGGLGVARACRAARWWCLALEAFALHAGGDTRGADSVFGAVARELAPDARCVWTDARELLEPDARQTYAALPCERKEAVTRNLWWVADPFLSEAWNERRAEHFARKVRTILASSLDFDERHQLGTTNGGDAILQVIMRYGWPSVAGWAGLAEDDGHTIWLGGRDLSPYASFEYSRARIHTVPAWRAIENPFAARSTDWTLNGLADDRMWWPFEHFAPLKPLVQLPDHQRAMLRRADSVLLAAAADLPLSILGRQSGQLIPDIRLVVSDTPDSARTIATRTVESGATAVMRAMTPVRSMLAGIEFVAARPSLPGGRIRFGIGDAPASLASFPQDSIAVSEPVLLVARAGTAPLPSAVDSALALMRGSTRLRGEKQVGVYWETYGIAADESIEVAIWIERTSRQGAFRRLGIALDLARDLNTPTSTRWTEARAGAAGTVIAGPVTIIGRSLRLDISGLPAGDYSLDVEVRRPGSAAVRGRRAFTIE
jgi:hypothetical protein